MENYFDNNINEESKNANKANPSFAKRFAKIAVKTISFGLAAGFIFGFSIPFSIGYVVPKVQAKLSPQDNVLTVSTLNDAISEDTKTVSMDEASKNTIEVIKKVKPSIVCITSVTQAQNIFRQTYQSEGSGSGIMFYRDTNNVYIATNNHVINGASSVSISINDSETLIPAKLVGKDANADLAVISVNVADITSAGINNIQLATFGDSDSVQVGESVIAIGNALGNGNTATAGIVSALQKDVTIQGRKLSVIQTDAAINPGNSGGALVNSKGQVIGINTAKIALAEVEGIGYSITSNVSKPIIEQLMNGANAPSLGVYILSVTEDIASEYNLPKAGVLVQEVIPGGSAANAGLKAGDVITAYNGSPIFTSEQLISAVKASKAGDTAKLSIVRNGQSQTINVPLSSGNNDF